MSNISRRKFLKKAIAVSAIPLILNANEEVIQDLNFIHITDSHMDLADDNSIEAMELMVEFINENYRDLDFVLFGGDNFNNNAPKNSDALKFKEIVDSLHCPTYTVRGNKESSPELDNDIRLAEFQELFLSNKNLKISGKDWSFKQNGYKILGLDSCIENSSNGRYTEETFNFAQNELDEGKPTLIICHHPYTNYVDGKENKDINKYVLKNAQETQKRLFKYDNLILTLSGHSHVDSVEEIQNTKVIATRGFIVPIELDAYPMRHITLHGNKISEKLIFTE